MGEMTHVLIVRPNDHAVLCSSDTKTLPLFRSEHSFSFISDSYQACEELCSQLNASFAVNFLRVEAEFLRDSDYYYGLYVLEVLCYGAPVPPHGHQWLPRHKVNEIKVEEGPARSSLCTFLSRYSEQGMAVNSDRLRAYSRLGWYSSACKWMESKVSETRNQTITKIVKLSSANSGCVLRAETESGERYFMKAVERGMSNEVTVANALQKVMPRRFSKLLAYDVDKSWMLMTDYGVSLTRDQCSLKRNAEFGKIVLNQWKCIQQESVAVADTLCRAGVPKVDGEVLLQMLTEVVDDENWIEAQRIGLIDEGVHEFDGENYRRKVLSYAEAVVAEVNKLDMPLCLVHGDLNPVNIARTYRDTKLSFFDFEGTMISYPFLDALTFGNACTNYDLEYADIRFYFEGWKNLGCGKFKNSFGLMEKLSRLFYLYYGYDFWRNAEKAEEKFVEVEMRMPLHGME